MRLTSEGAARIADEIVVHHSEHGEPVLNMTELENCQFEEFLKIWPNVMWAPFIKP